MKRQLLIFDLDGTLIDSRIDLCIGINLMRQHYQLPPLPVETVAAFIGDGIRKLVMRALDGHNINIDEAVRINYEFYLQHLHDHTILYPGVAEGLKVLHAHGHTQALISNKAREACLAILAHFGIARYFSSVIGGDSALPLKPAPDTVFETIRASGGAKTDTWMIGDNHTDLASARNAGVKSVFVTYGIGHPGAEIPSMKFNAFNALTRFFLESYSQSNP